MDHRYFQGFGLTIAFLLPGFISLVGLSVWSPPLESWLVLSPGTEPSIGSFLYVALASVAVGLTISAVRWAVIDTLHHCSGLPYPEFDFSKLEEKLDAYLVSVEFYYRYYQFYANSCIGVPLFWLNWRLSGRISGGLRLVDAVALFVEVVLFAASRDSLRRYYRRVGLLLGTKARVLRGTE